MAPSGAGEIAVLVVEDEALLLFTIADDLRAAGYRVFEATSAPAAIKLLDAYGNMDALFTDVDLPGGMDGLKLASLVRERAPAARVVVTSGHVSLPEGDLPSNAVFLPKPYTVEAVIAAVGSSSA